MAEPIKTRPADTTKTRAENRSLVNDGVIAGLLAGAIFAVAEMFFALAQGASALAPWGMFASILLGSSAIAGEVTFGIFLVGFIVHFALSAAFGAVWAGIARMVPPETRTNAGAHSVLAGLFGFAIWIVNFQIIARVLYPWFLGTSNLAQILLHVVAFGVPLGLLLSGRLRSARGEPVYRRRPA